LDIYCYYMCVGMYENGWMVCGRVCLVQGQIGKSDLV
jgi:hypothetical protein